MTSSMQIFNKDNFIVRTINEDDEIWFVAKDIMTALEYSEDSNPARIMQSVPEIWKGVKRIHTTSDKPTARPYQDVLCLSEQGLYFFLGRSDKPKALPYQMWVAGDVVPTIRRTGSYITKSNEEELKAKNKELDIRKVEILKHMLDLPYINEESKAVISHEIFRMTTGHECLAMLPETTEARYTATELGKMFGVSANKIGRIAKKYGIQSKKGEKSEYGMWICDKSRYSNHECMTFVYNDKAVAWFKNYFASHKK